jgi:integrase
LFSRVDLTLAADEARAINDLRDDRRDRRDLHPNCTFSEDRHHAMSIAQPRRPEVRSDAEIRHAAAGVVLKAAGVPCLYLENRRAAGGIWRYRGQDLAGAYRPIKLGEWPGMPYEDAVRAAFDIRDQLRRGQHVPGEREKRDAARAERAQAKLAAAARVAVDAAAREYVNARRDGRWKKRVRRPAQLERLLGYACAADVGAGRFGSLSIADLTSATIEELHQVITESRGPVLANRVHSRVRSLLDWAARPRGPLADRPFPVRGIRMNHEETRDRVLDDAEIAQLWAAADALGPPRSVWFRLLFWTACRGGELLGVRTTKDPAGRHAHYDAARGTIEIPAGGTKNGRAHVVPLPPPAIAALDALPRFGGGPYLFSRSGEAAANFRPHLKTQLDDLSGVRDWTFHDCRRTAASGLAALGVAPAVTAAILNHTSEGPVRGTLRVYHRHDYAAERRQALAAWARRLDEITQPAASAASPEGSQP